MLLWGDQYAEYERIRDLGVPYLDEALEDALDTIEHSPDSEEARGSRYTSIHGEPTVWIADAPPGSRAPFFRIYWQQQGGNQLILLIEDLS